MRVRRLGVPGIAAGLSIAIIAVLAGCSLFFPMSPPSSAGGDGELVAVPTAPRIVPDENGLVVCNQALMSGVLVSQPDWGISVGDAAGDTAPVFWPHGYVGRIAGDRIELLDDQRRVVARTGDHIKAAGGQATINGREGFRVCPGSIEVQPAAPSRLTT